jgi:hypothetical protein
MSSEHDLSWTSNFDVWEISPVSFPLTMYRRLSIYRKSVTKVRGNVTVRVKILRVFLGVLIFCEYSVSPNCLTLLYFHSVLTVLCHVWYCTIFGLVHRPVFKNTNLRQAICKTAWCLCIFIYRTSAKSKTVCCLIYVFLACVIYYSFVTSY